MFEGKGCRFLKRDIFGHVFPGIFQGVYSEIVSYRKNWRVLEGWMLVLVL